MDIFWVQLFLSFLVGGVWITLTTIGAEKLGTKIGGLIGGLPSTALVTFFFIGLVHGTSFASEATTVFPLIAVFDAVFVLIYASMIKKGLGPGLFWSLLAWLVLSSTVILLNPTNFLFIFTLYLVLFIISFLIAEKVLKIKSQKRVRIHYTTNQILGRTLFSGLIVALAVYLSKIGGPIFGGVMAAFPALFITTLIITYKSQGAEFSRAMTKPLMISGVINIVVFAIGVRYLYPTTGLVLGTLLAFGLSIVSTYFVYQILKKTA